MIPKTAVVLIHGVGEQRPMGTLWRFVDTVWSRDPDIVESWNGMTYAKPDTISDVLDLRRVTTRYWSGDDGRRRVDFYEYYWAHLMTGNSISGTLRWIRWLFIRPWPSVPRRLQGVWLCGMILFAVIAALFLVAIFRQSPSAMFGEWKFLLPVLVLAGGGLLVLRCLARVAGDAARYFNADPDNVDARQRIVRGGVQVIERLTRSGQYDRIIVVGHSLGSAIGLDILHTAFGRVDWGNVHHDKSEAASCLAALEKLSKPVDQKNFPLVAYRDAQRSYARSLAVGWDKGDARWLVSDFVTAGSPLSMAEILVAANATEFDLLKVRRQMPTCPPVLEQKQPPLFSFKAQGLPRVPHHGALFGPTVWTNIYFPAYATIFGDIISGPVAPLFGLGVRDVRLPSECFRLRHLDYWRLEPDVNQVPVAVKALRRAVNLRNLAENNLWLPNGMPK